MRRSIGVVSVLAMVCALGVSTPASAVTPRIVGGAPITIASVPWQVPILINSTLCSGSVIAGSWIVTAAHCVNGASASRISVFAGVTNLSDRTGRSQLAVSSVIVHPEYNAQTFLNDIALIGLAAPIAPSADLQPIALPTSQDPLQWPAGGTPAQISGWGSTSFQGSQSGTLLAGQVQVLLGPGQQGCGDYGPDFSPGQLICAGLPNGGVDACQGDSGGPLVINANGVPVLAGITSVGNECALARFPGLYTRVTTYLPWIKQYVPLAASAPLAPGLPLASALASERVSLTWTPSAGDGGSPITGYTATASPGSASCTTTQTSCEISGLSAGTAYSFSVTATNAAGTSVAAATETTTRAVDATTRAGRLIRSARWASWAGLKVPAGARVKALSVSPRICTTTPSGVRATQAGVCAVKVTVTPQTGKARSARAFAEVRN